MVIARMTLTWLAIARTRVSGINVSDAMAATKMENAKVKKRRVERGDCASEGGRCN